MADNTIQPAYHVHVAGAGYLHRVRQFRTALEQCRLAEKADPNVRQETDVLYTEGRANLMLGEMQGARRRLSEYAATQPKAPEADRAV